MISGGAGFTAPFFYIRTAILGFKSFCRKWFSVGKCDLPVLLVF